MRGREIPSRHWRATAGKRLASIFRELAVDHGNRSPIISPNCQRNTTAGVSSENASRGHEHIYFCRK